MRPYELGRLLEDYGRRLPENIQPVMSHWTGCRQALDGVRVALGDRRLMYYSKWFRQAKVIPLDKFNVYRLKNQPGSFMFDLWGEPNPRACYVHGVPDQPVLELPPGSGYFYEDELTIHPPLGAGEALFEVDTPALSLRWKQFVSVAGINREATQATWVNPDTLPPDSFMQALQERVNGQS